MKRPIFLSVLLIAFLFQPLQLAGQGKFKDTFQLIWMQSLGASTKQDGSLNYYVPIRFTGDFPMLNKKYNVAAYTSVYYVAKSDVAAVKIFSLYNGENLHSFYTDSIKSVTNKSLDLGLLSQGALVNFNFYNRDYRKGNNGILYLENSVETKAALYEVLICSNCTDSKINHQIQTYLALKYGIGLADKAKYFASDNRKIWNEKLDKSYNNHIIGLARDDYFGLDLQASYSNTDPSFILSKSKGQPHIPSADLTYVLAGNNNAKKTFDAKSGLYKRKWLIQNRGEADLKIDLRWNIQPNKQSEYYLHSDQGAVWHNDLNDSLQLVFRNVEIKKEQYYYLTLEERKNLEFKIHEEKEELNQRYFLTVNEAGVGPFHITATDVSSGEQHYFVSWDAQYNLGDLPAARYDFTVTDIHGKQARLTNIYLKKDQAILVSLDAVATGVSSATNPWVIHPNPVDIGEEFTVTYQLDKPKKLEFYIYTIDGKFILRKDLGEIQNNTYSYKLQGATTYLIVSVINSKASVQKLIVK